MKRVVLCLFSLLLFMSCTTSSSNCKYTVKNTSDEALLRGMTVAVALGKDGSSFEGKVYEGSGKILSDIIKQEILPYCKEVAIIEGKDTVKDFSEEELKNYGYIIIPKILLWEDKLADYSITSDAAKVTVEIYNSRAELLKTGSVWVKSNVTHGPGEKLTEQFKYLFGSMYK